MAKKLKIKFSENPSIIIHRTAVRHDKLVYIARANKKRGYPLRNKSRIVYIGTTKKGARRIASSAASKGEQLLDEYGMKHLEFNIVTCSRRQSVETWKKLERALIIRFRERFGLPCSQLVNRPRHLPTSSAPIPAPIIWCAWQRHQETRMDKTVLCA